MNMTRTIRKQLVREAEERWADQPWAGYWMDRLQNTMGALRRHIGKERSEEFITEIWDEGVSWKSLYQQVQERVIAVERANEITS